MFKQLLTPDGLKVITPIIGFAFAALAGYGFYTFAVDVQSRTNKAIEQNTAALTKLQATSDNMNTLLLKALGDKRTSGSLIESIREVAVSNAARVSGVAATSTWNR